MKEEITTNKHGFYQLKNKPNEKTLAEYYQRKYFKQSNSYNYELREYEIEAKYISAELILYCLEKLGATPGMKLFEIGFGEGFLLYTAKERGYKINGVDYSSDQLYNGNTGLDSCIQSSENPLKTFTDHPRTPDIVCLQHVVEHVPNPEVLLEKLSEKTEKDAYLVIEVPNDFSKLQNYLLQKDQITEEYWVAPPDHLSYFTEDSLVKLVTSYGFVHKQTVGSFPIEIFLLGDRTNYNKNKSIGGSAHQARCNFDRFMYSTWGIDKLYDFYTSQSLCDISRSITCIFQRL